MFFISALAAGLSIGALGEFARRALGSNEQGELTSFVCMVQ
jgi:hypothetical protein